VFQRLHQGDIEDIRHQGTGCRAARIVPDAFLAGVAAEVPHNEKIGIKAHRVDDVQLVFQALAHLGVVCPAGIPPPDAVLAELAQVGLGGLPFRDGEARQVVFLVGKVHVAALGKFQGVCHRLGLFAEEFLHFLRGAQVVAVIIHAHPVRVGQHRLGLDGEQNILQAGILPLDVMGVIGGNVAGMVVITPFQEVAVDNPQFGNGMLLQFKEEVIGTKDLVIPVQLAARQVGSALDDQAGHLACQAAGGADQPFSVFRQEFVVNAGVVVIPLQLRRRGDFQQVAVACLVFRQQQQVIGRAVQPGIPVGHAAGREVGFQPDDGADALLDGGIVELDHPVHGAVIGDCHRRHAQVFYPLDEPANIAEAIQQGILRMDVEVNKGHGRSTTRCGTRSGSLLLPPWWQP